jgi:ABC-type phosphate transport system auxiliary subunit
MSRSRSVQEIRSELQKRLTHLRKLEKRVSDLLTQQQRAVASQADSLKQSGASRRSRS